MTIYKTNIIDQVIAKVNVITTQRHRTKEQFSVLYCDFLHCRCSSTRGNQMGVIWEHGVSVENMENMENMNNMGNI